MTGTISVIIPVYQTEAYLEACLDSVLHQNYGHLEVILVDDGSKDGSGSICDRYAQKDSRVRVIHQKNGGGAAAKNTGLQIATGEYLSFVDSDDLLEPGAYGHMVQLMQTHEADVVRCSFCNLYRNRSEAHRYPEGTQVMEGKEFLRSFATDWTGGLLWNKLYKRRLFDGIFFEEGHKIDDEYFTYRGIMAAKKVVCNDRVVYHYRKRASSVMTSPASQLQITIDRIDFMDKRRKIVAKQFPELRRDFDVSFLDALTYLPDYPGNFPESIAAYRRYGIAYFRESSSTFPPRYLLRGLLRLYLTPAKKLIEKADQNRKPVDMDELFA